MDKEKLKISVLFSLSMALVIIFAAFARNLLSTNSIVKINTAKESVISEGFLSYFAGNWYFSDEIIVASGSSIDFSATFVSILYPSSSLNQFPNFMVGLVDVTDDAANTNAEEIQNFSTKIDAHLATKKGRKYRISLYSSQTIKEKEIAINISGCDKIRTYFFNKKNNSRT